MTIWANPIDLWANLKPESSWGLLNSQFCELGLCRG